MYIKSLSCTYLLIGKVLFDLRKPYNSLLGCKELNNVYTVGTKSQIAIRELYENVPIFVAERSYVPHVQM